MASASYLALARVVVVAMKPLAIRARNFRTWAELDLEVPSGIAAIVGPNGAGKSSIVEAIDLALFGTGKELGRATTRGFDDVELELLFEHGRQTYRVRRGRYKGKPTLELVGRLTGYDEVPWTALTAEKITTTQELLEELLGLSRQTFRASSFLAQGDGAAFTMAEPRDRKAILLDALGVRVWDRLKEQATVRRSEAEDVEKTGRGRLGALAAAAASGMDAKAELAQWNAGVSQARLRIEDLEGATGKVRARLEEAIAAERAYDRHLELTARLERLRSLTGNGELSEDVRTELKAKIAKAEQAEKALELERRRGPIVAECERLEDIQERIAVEEKRLDEESDRLVEELGQASDELAGLRECPTCGQPLDDVAKRRAGEALRGRLSALEEKQGETLKRAAHAREEGARLATERVTKEAEARELLIIGTKLTELVGPNPELALAEARTAERELATLEERTAGLVAMKQEAEELARELEALGSPERVDVASIRRELADAEAELRAMGPRLADYERLAGGAEERVRRAEEAEREYELLARELLEQSERLEVLRLAERAYGRDGIPALILETSAIPHLEAEANRIVSELGREYRFELRTQRETQAGGVKDVLDVVVHTRAGEALYEDFSGGERTRLDLSLRIALARLLAARRGADVRILAIDEPAFLDDEGFAQLAGVLAELAGEFETILVVSHVEALRDAFDNAIIVGGGADTGEPSRLEEV